LVQWAGACAAFTPQYQSDSRVLAVLRDHVLMPVGGMPPVPRILSVLVRGRIACRWGSSPMVEGFAVPSAGIG